MHPNGRNSFGPARELKYLLRAYDSKVISTTDARRCGLYREPSRGSVVTSDGSATRELLAAYGENQLARQQIPLGSGTVKVQGSGIPAGHTVWVAGRQIPVDPQGNFAAEEILPPARIASKSRSSTMRATAHCIFATSSSNARTSSTSALPT